MKKYKNDNMCNHCSLENEVLLLIIKKSFISYRLIFKNYLYDSYVPDYGGMPQKVDKKN